MEMEKSCEFCMVLRPTVYCKADAAHLCLSCDAKVHSANALSNRHPRTPLCESCRYRPAYVQCSQHQMFMCHGCDRHQHDLSSQHQKKVISSYVGCPSAKDFAALWGFDLNELDNTTFQNEFLSTSNSTVDKGKRTFDIPIQSCSVEVFSSVSEVTSTICSLADVGSSSGQIEGFGEAIQCQNTSYILQQILDLKRLQLNQGSANSSFVGVQEETDASSVKYNSKWKLRDDLDQNLQHSLDLGSDLHCLGSLPEKVTGESFPLAFSQPDGDIFWHIKSSFQSSQLWPQNMQDLGVCDDLVCNDDFVMPEVDMTFKSIEELFGGEQELTRVLPDGKDTFCSSLEKDLSIDKSDNGYERSVEDVSAASSACMSHSDNLDKDIGSPDNIYHCPTTKDSGHLIQPSCSALSLFRLSAESSAPEYLDSEPSSTFMRQQHSCNSSDIDRAQLEGKQNFIMRYKEKKKIRRNEKQAHYSCRKSRSDVKKLVRGQFIRGEDYESDGVNVSRSL